MVIWYVLIYNVTGVCKCVRVNNTTYPAAGILYVLTKELLLSFTFATSSYTVTRSHTLSRIVCRVPLTLTSDGWLERSICWMGEQNRKKVSTGMLV